MKKLFTAGAQRASPSRFSMKKQASINAKDISGAGIVGAGITTNMKKGLLLG